jgi:hypothetical protein
MHVSFSQTSTATRQPARYRTISTAASPRVSSDASSTICQASASARAALAAAAAGLLLATTSFAGPSLAYNVRLQDVESPVLQAGLRAATGGKFVEAERVRRAALEASHAGCCIQGVEDKHQGVARTHHYGTYLLHGSICQLLSVSAPLHADADINADICSLGQAVLSFRLHKSPCIPSETTSSLRPIHVPSIPLPL